MKRMSTGGFTIVETLIVLGVTGVLFVSLAAMVSGQQSRARFKASITDISTKIQSQINEVSTGYYPNAGNFNCTVASSGAPVITAASKQLGTNEKCTYLGRAVMLGIPDTDPEQYLVHTLVGLRTDGAGEQPLTLGDAQTRPMAPGVLYNVGWDTRYITTLELQSGLRVVSMVDGSGRKISGFAVVAAPNNQLTMTSNNTLESGTIVPTIIPIPHNGPSGDVGLRSAPGVDQIVRALGLSTSTASQADGPVKICFQSGTTNQSALVTVGDRSSTTSVNTVIKDTTDCS